MTAPAQRPANIDVAGLMHRIAAVMERDDIGVNEVARRTGLTSGYVSMILSGKREQTLAKALLLAHAVGLAHIGDEA